MSKSTTKLSISHSIFGAPWAELPSTQLPLQSEVVRHFLFLKTNKHKSNKKIIPVLGQLLIEIWNRASIPPQPLKNVNTKLSQLMERGSEASKQGNQARKMLKVKENLTKLFDIAFCQCLNLASCCCPKEMRVPKREQTFLTDQRAIRNMHIGKLDKKVSKANKKNMVGRINCYKEKRQRFNERSNFHHLILGWHLLLTLMLLVVAIVTVAAFSVKNFLI